jgi:hypothetical protein
VNSESLPSIKVKSCNSCRRTLPTHYFGLRKYSDDGYNPCCKECRNFRRRRAYRFPNDIDEPIFPLNEHNHRFLWSLNKNPRVEFLVGLEVSTLQSTKVKLDRNSRDYFSLTVQYQSGSSRTHIHGGDFSEFVEFAILLLERCGVRLFHPEDHIALNNWGLNRAPDSLKSTVACES